MSEVNDTTPSGLSQSGRLGFLLKDTALYGGAAAVSSLLALITFPLLARHFSLLDYGVLDYFLVLASFMAITFVFGQDSAVARYFYEREDTVERRQLISQSLLFQFAGLAVLLPLLWMGADWIAGFLIDTPDSVRLFRIVLLQLPFLLLISFTQGLLKWTFARNQYLVMAIGFAVLQTTSLAVAVLVFNVGLEGVLLVGLSTNTVFGVLGLFFIRKWLVLPRNSERLREMLPYAVPIGIVCVVGAFSPTLERTLIVDLIGIQSLGLYAVATKIAILTGLVVSAFQTAWGPFFLSLHKQANAAVTFNLVLKLFTFLMCLMVLTLTLLAKPLILLLASDRYVDAAVVVFPLAMGLAIQAVGWITDIGIGLSMRSYLSLYAYAAALACTVITIVVLAPLLGLFGVGVGVMCGFLVRAVVGSWLSQRSYPLPWNYASTVTVMSMTIVVGLMATWIGQHWGAPAQAVTLVVCIAGLLVLGWNGMLTATERLQVRNYIGARSG